MPRVQRNFRLPQELADGLAEYAKSNGTTQNDAVAEAIADLLSEGDKPDSEEPAGSNAELVTVLREQLVAKDEQIASLTRLLDQQQQLTGLTARRSLGSIIRGLIGGR